MTNPAPSADGKTRITLERVDEFMCTAGSIASLTGVFMLILMWIWHHV